MRLVDVYLFRQALSAFLAMLVVLTAMVYLSQMLRELDILTTQGQTFLVFIRMTAYTIPMFIGVIAPIALFAALVYVLQKTSADSELIVLSAAGLSPLRVSRALAVLAILVVALQAFISLHAQPWALNQMRYLIAQVRADVLANIVREGEFRTIVKGTTFHIRERGPQGSLLGILVEDGRKAGERVTYIAERGWTVETEEGTFLVLEKGSLQRRVEKNGDINIVTFERYSFDLSDLTPKDNTTFFKPRERLTIDLINQDPKEEYYTWQPGRFRSELHDRFSSPLYPLAFFAIAAAALGRPKTTRQGRGIAIAFAVLTMVLVRVAGFIAIQMATRHAWAVWLMYAVPLLAAALGLAMAGGLVRLTVPPRWERAVSGALGAGLALAGRMPRLRLGRREAPA